MTGWWPRVGMVLTAVSPSVSSFPPLPASSVKTEEKERIEHSYNWQARAKLVGPTEAWTEAPYFPMVWCKYLRLLFPRTQTSQTNPDHYLLNERRIKSVEKIRRLMLRDFLQTTVGLNIWALYRFEWFVGPSQQRLLHHRRSGPHQVKIWTSVEYFCSNTKVLHCYIQ